VKEEGLAAVYPINLWINEERYERLRQAGLAELAQDVLAGMRVLKLPCSGEQKDELLRRYPAAKFDSATTGSIELLPPDVKDRLFELVVARGSVNVVGELLNKKEGDN
jgi:hypothetical protein